MLESLDLLAQMGRGNINVLSVDDRYIVYEYQWRPKPSKVRWSKAVYQMSEGMLLSAALNDIIETVRGLRARLESVEYER